MDKKVTIRVHVLGSSYQFNDITPDKEELIRKAAKNLDQNANELKVKFLDKPNSDIEKMLALNEGIRAEMLQKELDRLKKEIDSLHNEFKSYLEKIV